MPCSLTPVGLLAPGQYSAGVLSPLWRYQNDPDDTCLSRLYHTAFGLAVYASQAPLRDAPTQDSLPAGGQPLPGRIWTCRVPMKGFRSVDNGCLPRFLLSQASPGAHRQVPSWEADRLKTSGVQPHFLLWADLSAATNTKRFCPTSTELEANSRSLEGVLRAAQAFDRLGDREAADHAMRVAQRM